MSQANFLSVRRGKARVVIKTGVKDELPTFELDMEFTKANATKLLIYAIELAAKEGK